MCADCCILDGRPQEGDCKTHKTTLERRKKRVDELEKQREHKYAEGASVMRSIDKGNEIIVKSRKELEQEYEERIRQLCTTGLPTVEDDDAMEDVQSSTQSFAERNEMPSWSLPSFITGNMLPPHKVRDPSTSMESVLVSMVSFRPV